MAHNPTRLPYGLSFVKPGVASTEYTFVAGDQTPDVSYGTYFVTAASALTITNFDGGERGKVIFVRSGSAGAITLQNSAGGINMRSMTVSVSAGILKYASTGNYVMGLYDVAQFAHNGTDWDQVGSLVTI